MTASRATAASAAIVGCLGAALAVLVLHQTQSLFFYQNFTPEVVFAACGRSLAHPGITPASMRDFTLGMAPSFDCADLGAIEPTGPVGLFLRLQLYLSHVVLLLWRGPVLTQWQLWPIVALLSGAFAAGTFCLLRLFFPLRLALAGGLVLAASPVALSLTTQLRDYSKAPFFVWALVFVILAARSGSTRRVCGFGALAGAVIGIGIGFRGDGIVLVPFSLVALFATSSAKVMLRRAAGAACLVLAFLTMSWPILTAGSVAGTSGSFILQGLSEPYEAFLGLDPAPYDFGNAYLDELALSSIAAAERPLTPRWDENEAEPLYGTTQAIRLSNKNVRTWLPAFPADMATQGLKSAAWIIAFPVLVAKGRSPDPGYPIRQGPSATKGLDPLYDAIGKAWFVPIFLLGAVLFLWRETALRPESVTVVTVLFALCLAYTTVQFSVRHVFQLEFFWMASALGLVAAVWDRDRLIGAARRFFVPFAIALVFVAITYGAFALVQQATLTRTFDALLSLPRETLAGAVTTEAGTTGERRRFAVPVSAKHAAIVRSAPDSMRDDLPWMGLQWDVRAEADRLLLTANRCPPGRYTAHVDYEHRPGIWQKLDRTVSVEIGDLPGETHVLIPAFYRPTQNLASVAFEPVPAGCDVNVERIEGASSLPPLLTAVLAPNWRDLWLMRGFGGFGMAP